MRYITPLAFFSFICQIIYDADSKTPNILIQYASQIPFGDKLGHIILYGLLAFLINYALNFKKIRRLGFELQVGALLVLAFAFIEEGTQLFFPTRTFSLADALCDVIGVVLFSYLGLYLQKVARRYWPVQSLTVKNEKE